jgi:quinoprotein glucose dehydrogenase
MNITVDQQPVKAIAQVSKQGFVYVLDRRTGEPIWPIVETPVPQSVVPGEQTSLTQPIPTKPPPFVRQGSAREDLADPSSADGYDVGPLYTPPTENGLIVTPGEGGGANWGGASFDPQTQTLYVTGFGPLTYLIRMVYGGLNFYYASPQAFYGPTTGSPYGGAGSSITAYDMNEGTINWQEPGTPYASAIGLGAVLTTKTLLF